jgi:hypothetical protein
MRYDLPLVYLHYQLHIYLVMPSNIEVIDLAGEDDLDDQFESIPIPDDIEEIEAMPVAGPSRKREVKSNSIERTNNFGDKFDEQQAIRGKIAKLDVEVRNVHRHSLIARKRASRRRSQISKRFGTS